MYKIGTFRLALTYAGCFLGAGYLSGQELQQFFGVFGVDGVWGLIFAVLLLAAFGVLLLLLVRHTAITQMDKLIVPQEIGWLRDLIGMLAALFLFGVAVVMSAGAGALFHQLVGGTAAQGSAIFCLLTVVFAIGGCRAMVNVFSLLVPLLVLFTLVFSVAALADYGWPQFDVAVQDTNQLISSWPLAMLTFVSYNLFGTIGVIAPVAPAVDDRRTVVRGVILGCLLLALIAGAVLAALAAYPPSVNYQLPMLALAEQISVVWSIIYAVLLFGGMFITSLSCTVALLTFIRQRWPLLGVRLCPPCQVTVVGLLMWVCSLAGFGELISVVYPLFGYIGIAALVSLAVQGVKIHRSTNL